MRNEKRIKVAEMQRRLQARMNYKNPERAMNILLLGFQKARKYIGWAMNARRNGMIPSVAHEFAEYVGYPIDRD